MKLDADKAANVKGSTVVAGKDINITGENVRIENSNSIYNAQEKHEFKRTGLSVSVGGAYVDVVNNAANSVKHATEVEDKRLGALVVRKGYKDAKKDLNKIDGKSLKASFKSAVYEKNQARIASLVKIIFIS